MIIVSFLGVRRRMLSDVGPNSDIGTSMPATSLTSESNLWLFTCTGNHLLIGLSILKDDQWLVMPFDDICWDEHTAYHFPGVFLSARCTAAT
jgi:hypothetical protein